MTKVSFSKTMFVVLGVMCLLLASMSFYSGISYGTQIGIAGYLLGAILIILGSAIGMDKDVVASKAKRMGLVAGVVLVTIVLHAAGIWAFNHIHWIAGVGLILLGLVNLMFIAPATKGFAESK